MIYYDVALVGGGAAFSDTSSGTKELLYSSFKQEFLSYLYGCILPNNDIATNCVESKDIQRSLVLVLLAFEEWTVFLCIFVMAASYYYPQII